MKTEGKPRKTKENLGEASLSPLGFVTGLTGLTGFGVSEGVTNPQYSRLIHGLREYTGKLPQTKVIFSMN